jgi:hypothetical protein
MNDECTDLAQFIRGEVDPGSFRPERLATDAARRTFLLPDPHSTGDRR